MFTNHFLKLTFAVSVLYTLNVVQQAESTTILDENSPQYPVVYRRFIRRRPPMHPHDKYMEEIIEIFHTKERPPATGSIMTDEDVDKFIYCDFNRHLEECKKYWESQKRKSPTDPTAPSTSKPIIITSTTAKTTTSASELEPTDEFSGIPHLDDYYYDYGVKEETNNDYEADGNKVYDDYY